jgi:hypothetical protein
MMLLQVSKCCAEGRRKQALGGRLADRDGGTQGSFMEFRTLSRRDAFRDVNLVEIEDAETSLSG